LLVSVPITMNFGLSMNTRARPALVGTDWNVHALPVAPDSRFRRGDANDDGGVNIADALRILSFLFTGATPPACEDAADGNDDGGLDISDALAILGFLFLGSEAPPVPGPTTCGSDLTPDALGRCTDPAGSCD
jgi:hypothetical protein